MLTFKQYYKREINAVRFAYGETFKEAKFNIDSLRNIQKEYCEYLSLQYAISAKIYNTIPDKALKYLFCKNNAEKLTK